MNETTIGLPEETVNYLQRQDYEIGGLQVLHTHALKAGAPLEKRMEIRRELLDRYTEYQLAKQEMWAEFAHRFPAAKSWWVDFQTGELHVEVRPLQPSVSTGAPPPKGEVKGRASGKFMEAAPTATCVGPRIGWLDKTPEVTANA